MGHTDDAYATMLLTMALSPNKEEYARPLGVAEFRRFEAAARASSYGSIGALLDMDISGLMLYLGLTEEESYRAYTLLHRSVQLSYAMDGFAAQGIDVVTQYDAEYPERARRRLADAAPPCFYCCGNAGLIGKPAVAILGVGGVRTTDAARQTIEIGLNLLGMDISGLMAYLNLTEEEGYRVFTLLNRTVQLSYALEGYIRANVDVVTLYDAEYPERLTRRLGEAAPPFFYRAGRPDLLDRPAIALMGISGVRTTPEVRDAVNVLVR
ncbi:MAG: hypothetical protein IJH09_07175, partial [Clostridia bacterium]|nr:hypothetical protein [Clostridia bacterium]